MAESEAEKPDSAQESVPLIESFDLEQLREIVRLCRENDIAELKIRHRGTRIHIKGRAAAAPVEYGPASSVHASVPPSVAERAGDEAGLAKDQEGVLAEEANYVTVRSPMVGTFYLAPAPDAPPFVEVDDTVKENTVLCIVEAMKLMNEIKAETRGTVAKILVDNGQPVEYNQPLFLIKPE
jgi:acetyl-CoA carboxylase biotin carboxyl carrier protein